MNNEITSLNGIRAKIKEKKIRWQAERTSVSGLSEQEKKMKLGLKLTDKQKQMVSRLSLDRPEIRAIKKLKYKPAVGLPDSIDWRNVNGADWTTPVKDQGGCGSCVAFGTVATLEALLKIRTYNDASINIDLSEAHLFYCGCGDCCNSGWYMDDACNYLKNNGVPDEDCFPYQDSGVSCANTCSDWTDRIDHTKITNWANTLDVNTMKDNLANNGPQITGMAVYEDFFYYSSGIYEYAYGDLAGYHCISVVGYDDTNACWICKNSWGPGWGESGYFRIAYGQCGMDDGFGMWNMEVPSPEGNGYAQYILVDYDCNSDNRVLWAYAGDAWRYKYLTDDEVAGIAKLLMESCSVYVYWKEDQLTYISGIK
ncbi:Papain family cysteine protease [uncultured archaeon]|nr:Papain family cysteine protease [uncultured archaeon]